MSSNAANLMVLAARCDLWREGGVEKEQLACRAGRGLVRAHERDDAAVGQALDGGGELISVSVWKATRPSITSPRAVRDQTVVALGEDVLKHADDHVVVDVGGRRRPVVGRRTPHEAPPWRPSYRRRHRQRGSPR